MTAKGDSGGVAVPRVVGVTSSYPSCSGGPTAPRVAVTLILSLCWCPHCAQNSPDHCAVPVVVPLPSQVLSPGCQWPCACPVPGVAVPPVRLGCWCWPWWPSPCAYPVPAVVFGEHSLLVTVSGQKLFVVKRQNHVQEPVAV